MFIFQRVVTLTGGPRKSSEWAAEVTDFVRSNSDFDPLLWTGGFGYPLGTVAWTARVDSRAALADGMNTLMTNSAYHDLIEKGQDLVAAPGHDLLLELVHPEALSDQVPPMGSVAELITAVAAEGKLAASMAWGVEIAQIYGEVTGASPSFFADGYGPFGKVTWIIVHPDAAAADAANAAANSSADYIAAIDGANDLFVPMSGMRSMATRVG